MAGIEKSSRHQKIIGEFGEHIVCNWLSRTGYEVARVDHTGIDVVAYDPVSHKRLGITVKSRTRTIGKEAESVTILRGDDREKLVSACEAFGCEPWVGVYVETFSFGDLFLVSLADYESRYRSLESRSATWKMRVRNFLEYFRDGRIQHLRVNFDFDRWGRSRRDQRIEQPVDVQEVADGLVKTLPKKAYSTDVIQVIQDILKIHRGLAEVDAGHTVPHEDVVRYLRDKVGISLHD